MRPSTILSRLQCAALCTFLLACGTAPVLPQDGFVQVPGGRVAFRVMGTGNAVPVLMIHGGPGGNSCGFASTMSGLAGTRPVVMYDQLGTGNSDRMTDLARDATLERFVAEVMEIRTRLGLAEVHLVGHSWGATVALEYLLTAKPSGVKSVSFVGPLLSTPIWIEDAKALVESLPAESRDAINAAIGAGKFDTPAFESANKVFNQHFNARTVISKERSEKEFGPCRSSPVRFNKGLYEHMWGPSEFVSTGTLRTYDRLDRLKELKLPTMFLVGEYDEARPATMRKFQAQVPGSVVKVIPNAAHSVNIDATREFNDALAGFMASAERR
jgi:proline iminopeptidase